MDKRLYDAETLAKQIANLDIAGLTLIESTVKAAMRKARANAELRAIRIVHRH